MLEKYNSSSWNDPIIVTDAVWIIKWNTLVCIAQRSDFPFHLIQVYCALYLDTTPVVMYVTISA
jgi:hypothetical protein